MCEPRQRKETMTHVKVWNFPGIHIAKTVPRLSRQERSSSCSRSSLDALGVQWRSEALLATATWNALLPRSCRVPRRRQDSSLRCRRCWHHPFASALCLDSEVIVSRQSGAHSTKLCIQSSLQYLPSPTPVSPFPAHFSVVLLQRFRTTPTFLLLSLKWEPSSKDLGTPLLVLRLFRFPAFFGQLQKF